MCFLKKFERISTVPLTKSSVVDDTDAYSADESVLGRKNDNLILGSLDFPKKPQKHQNQEMLMNLVSLLNYNSVLLSSLQKVMNYLNQKINQTNETLEDLSVEMNQKKQEIYQATSIEHIQSESIMEVGSVGHFSQEGLTQKLFGKKSYKYSLRLVDEVPSIIYKQRNLSFRVQLISQDGQMIRNSNIIHLCMGVSDSNGEWISQTRTGEDFMKGKTETELYHGEGNYSKIYPRDVSRYYENGKVNFVIYPKPSMLYYSGNNSSLQSKVNFDEIEPLIVKDLTIRAKKKD